MVSVLVVLVDIPEHSKAIYGKVLPIHIERNQARSDGLTD